LTAQRASGEALAMPTLKVQGTDQVIGQISDTQLQFLVQQLEEEHDEDRDYYIDRETLEMFEENGGDPELVEMLRKALGDSEALDIEWE
jgi:processive 1,2-diacylglycerol beta-glucosyltransferase